VKSQSTFSRLQITEEAKSALARQSTRHGLSQTELASRLVTWLIKQPTVIQAAVLNNIDRGLQDELSQMLKANTGRRLGATSRKKPSSRKRA
jgi:1,2-phenylacetyl-CoA epoxidase catalytic subunit